MNIDLLDNLVPNPESGTTGSSFFTQGMCFVIIPYNSNYYIFDLHSRDSLSQSSENSYSILLLFVTSENVLNFITTTYLINNHLLHGYEKHFFLLKLKDQQKGVL